MAKPPQVFGTGKRARAIPGFSRLADGRFRFDRWVNGTRYTRTFDPEESRDVERCQVAAETMIADARAGRLETVKLALVDGLHLAPAIPDHDNEGSSRPGHARRSG